MRSQARPTGLHFDANTLLLDVTTPKGTAQNDPAKWFDCADISPVNDPSTAARGHEWLRLQTGRCMSAAAAGNTGSASPKGRASTCSSPKSPQVSAAAQLKSLQRTPLPLILARMKVLLERLNMLIDDGSCPSPAAATSGAYAPTAAAPRTWQRPASPSTTAAITLDRNMLGLTAAAATATPASSKSVLAGIMTPAGARGSSGGGCRSSSCGGGRPGQPQGFRKPAKAKTEVSTSGGLAQSVMQQSAQSVLSELDVTLGFISEFLGSVSSDTRKALATVARLESYKKDQLIYDIGDDPSHFYIILSGRIDLWSHPPGTHRPKSIVSVLRRGDAFGDQAIINGEPHGTAASPSTNVTLLVVTKQDFMTVLGSHFHDVAASWQHFLVTHVAPMAECDPGMVRRLCSALVSEKPPTGQECDLSEDQVCFIQAGTFEVRLVDLQAQHTAEAALAAAIASASSALPIAPIPQHLRLGPDGSSSSSSRQRPGSAPAGALHRGPVTHQAAPAAAAAAGGGLVGGTRASAATSAPTTSSSSSKNAQTAGSSGVQTRGVSGSGGVAAGMEMLRSDLAHCPALGDEGVLASVRVKDGRLVGTQGLARELRKQHSTCVPFKVVAMLGPGGWYGGGDAIYGCGPLQSALRVVAVGPDCEVIRSHLSGLEKHGGPALIKRLRDDAALKLTYYLGRIGSLTLGMAVGHPDSTLVAEAAAAAAVEGVGGSARGPGSSRLTAAAAAGGGGSGGPVATSPGRSPCSTFRGRPASAAAGGGSAAAAAGGGGGCDAPAAAAAAAAAHKRRPGSARSCLSAGDALQVATGGAGRSRPTSAATKLGFVSTKAAAGGSIRRSSSTDGSDISSAWDDPTIGALMPSTAAADGTSGSALCLQSTAAEAAAAVPAAAVLAAAGVASAGALAADTASQISSSAFLTKISRAQKQKRVHVPGSGVFGPGVMAALLHVKALQAADDAASSQCAAASAGSTCSGREAFQRSGREPRELSPRSGQCGTAAAEDRGTSSISIGSGLVARAPPAEAATTASSSQQSGDAVIAAASLRDGSTAPAAAGAGPRSSIGLLGPLRASRPASAAAGCGSSCDTSTTRRPMTASAAAAAAAGRAGTAADVYWQQPDHSSSATGVALSGLLSSLFTDGLQPLVSQLDCLLSHTDQQAQHSPVQQQQHVQHAQLQEHAQAGSLQQLSSQQLQQGQQQSWQQLVRPASAAPRLQQQPGLQQHVSRPQPVAGTQQQHGLQQHTGRPQSANPKSWGRQPHTNPHTASRQAGSLQQYGCPDVGALRHTQGMAGKGQQQGLQGEVLRHKTTASLLAASVMWQRSSEAAFRPPLRQCLTSAEIAAQRGCVTEADQ